MVPLYFVFIKHFLRLFSIWGFIFLSGVFLRAYLGFSKKSQWEHCCGVSPGAYIAVGSATSVVS